MKNNSDRLQDAYQVAIRFAAIKHGSINQKVKGTDLPYLMHLSTVAMEILVAVGQCEEMDLTFAVQVALLHDTIEDPKVEHKELEEVFGRVIADAVLALTKIESPLLTAEEKMIDSLDRIRQQPKEVWCVKLADRITNLQKPPESWGFDKRNTYAKEADLILETLRGASAFLEKRLAKKILEYRSLYCQ